MILFDGDDIYNIYNVYNISQLFYAFKTNGYVIL